MNVFELFAKIGLDSSDYESGLSKAASMGKSVMSGIGNVAKAGMGVAAAAIGAGTAAMGAFGKQSLDAFASYEQLAGGVEKLFGESATATDTLMKNAEQAYRTAGMSANQYMDTAMQFSASMISSLDGNLEEAANMTDVAMRAMSDNVNTFGSNMQDVSNAFKGFSKANFTMLDNLKLGYGGTKEEMERLLRDAEKYEGLIEGSLKIDSFSDIVEAIDIVQEHLNIAGTTAKEAMTTIEGASTMTKAAWENVITAIGRGEGLEEAMGGLKDAIFGVGLTDDGKETGLLNQIIPRIQTIMEGAGDFIVESAPLISDKLPELIDAVLPSLLEGGISLAGAIGKGLISALPSIWTSVESAASTVGDYLSKGMDAAAKATEGVDFATPIGNALDKVDELLNGEKTQTFIENGVKVVTNLATGIGEGAPEIIPRAAEIVTTFIDNLTNNIPALIEAGGNLIVGVAEGIIKATPKVALAVIQMRLKVMGYIAEMALNVAAKAREGFVNLVNAAAQILPQLPEKVAYYAVYTVTRFFLELGKLVIKAEEAFKKVISKAKEFGKDLEEKGKEAVNLLNDVISGGLDKLIEMAWNKACEIGTKIFEGIKSKLGSLGSFIAGLVDSGVQGANDAANDALHKPKSVNGRISLTEEVGDSDNDIFASDSKGFDYDALGSAIVKAFTDAKIIVECDNREFGRLVRKVVTA